MHLTKYKDIPGYKGIYGIYEYPIRIVSLIKRGNSHFRKILKLNLNPYGYLCVDLYKNNKRKHYKIHTLVLIAFKGPKPFDNAVCKHIDGNKLNNDPKNLCWGTYLSNNNDKIIHGTSKNVHSGLNHFRSKFIRNDIIKIHKLHNDGLSNRKIAVIFGVSHTTIGSIVNKKSYKNE